jgi:hypothetical protein
VSCLFSDELRRRIFRSLISTKASLHTVAIVFFLINLSSVFVEIKLSHVFVWYVYLWVRTICVHVCCCAMVPPLPPHPLLPSSLDTVVIHRKRGDENLLYKIVDNIAHIKKDEWYPSPCFSFFFFSLSLIIFLF